MAIPKQIENNMIEMKDILILYERMDSEVWAKFIEDCFSGCPQSLTIESKDLRTNIKEIGVLSTRFSMVLMIVSNEMLKTMAADTVICILDPNLRNHPCISVIKLYVEQDLFANKVMPYYHGAQSWKCISVGTNDGEDHVQQMISEIIDMLQNVTVPEMQAPLVPGPRKTMIQSVCPDYIRQGGETMTMVLRNPIHEGQCVQICIGDKARKIDTVTLNKYCFTFKAPAHKAGRADLRLYIDGKKITKMVVHYSSMLKFAYSCPEFLCQLIGLNPDNKAGLDKELTNIFNASSPQDGSLQFLLSPKNLLTVSSAGTTDSCGELPTLLHFACRYGLNDLAVSITNTPGSHIALDMDNDLGLNPLDLAREANNEDLVHYLESFVDMHDYVTDIELIYERVSGGQQLQPYMNADTHSDESKSKYLDMRGGESVEEAYTPGRVAGGSDSDYEITGLVTGLVEEVEEEDDVLPEVPERKPSVNRQSEVAASSCNQISHKVQPRTKQGNWKTSVSMPKDDIFGESIPLSPMSMGSSTLEDLNQYAEAYRNGDFSLEDIERLCRAWHDRNRDVISCSLKERKKQMDVMKESYKTVLSAQKAKRKKSIFSWKTKEKRPEIEIHHNVQPNKYESWAIMRDTPSTRANCDSTISNTSTTSSSSCSSHDSALGSLRENSSDSDGSDNKVTGGNVARRKISGQRRSDEQKRESWGNQFLKTVQNRPHSRLPKPPPHKPVYVTHRPSPARPPKPEGTPPPVQPRRPLIKKSSC